MPISKRLKNSPDWNLKFCILLTVSAFVMICIAYVKGLFLLNILACSFICLGIVQYLEWQDGVTAQKKLTLKKIKKRLEAYEIHKDSTVNKAELPNLLNKKDGRNGAILMLSMLKNALRNGRQPVDPYTLLSVLSAIAGYSCQISARTRGNILSKSAMPKSDAEKNYVEDMLDLHLIGSDFAYINNLMMGKHDTGYTQVIKNKRFPKYALFDEVVKDPFFEGVLIPDVSPFIKRTAMTLEESSFKASDSIDVNTAHSPIDYLITVWPKVEAIFSAHSPLKTHWYAISVLSIKMALEQIKHQTMVQEKKEINKHHLLHIIFTTSFWMSQIDLQSMRATT